MTLEILTYAVAAIVIVAAVLDAKTAKIPNWLIYVLLALFGVKAAVFPASVDLYWQIGVAVGIFAVGLGAFALGAIGAGAVKLLAAVMLFMPLGSWGWLVATFIGATFLFTFIFIAVRSAIGSEDSKWASMRKRIVPMSFPIGTMALLGLFYL